MAKKNAQEKLDVPNGLKILCILSFIGFAASMAIDTMNYLSFSSVDEMRLAADQAPFEQMEDVMDILSEKGVDVSERGMMQISKMYVFRAIIDVLALLGVSMMFIRLKMGYTIYVIGQLTYIAIPIGMFGLLGVHIVGVGSIAITLIYVLLFTTQKRHLIR